ncbi:MAG: hypothetical protein JKY52_09650 [Flavobacteriales bacterium]|nr:hypothetical protein [Flavobacteriales bacterium]
MMKMKNYDEIRNEIATAAMAAMISKSEYRTFDREGIVEAHMIVARGAVNYADALLIVLAGD